MEGNGITDDLRDTLLRELEFSFTRSSGPGGQHANKVSTCAVLKFNLEESKAFTELQRIRIKNKLKSRLTSEGCLVLEAQEERSQIRNKDIVLKRFFDLIDEALTPPKKRVPTKPTKASRIHRMNEKRKTSEKKELRKPPNL